jgi:ribonuclease HI
MEITIIVDGGSLGNGGANAVGYGSFLAYPSDQEAYPTSKKPHRLHFGEGITNNEAEYSSLIKALAFVKGAMLAAATDLSTISITVYTDSQLIVGHMTLGWKCKALNLQPLLDEVKELCSCFRVVSFNKVPEKEMKEILGH